MHVFKELRYDIAASLWIKPCKEDELKERDFLKNIGLYFIQRSLQHLENDKMIYLDKNNVYHTYKSALKELNKNDYQLQ